LVEGVLVDTGTRFRIVLGQRASWPELLARTRETEELGFDGLFLVDHFYGLFDLAHPTHEGYTMLAALAPFTQRLRLGLLVAGNTYRNPAFLLKQAVTVDHISGGRVDFGVGAGWVEREHEAYGFPFPSARERVDRFAEALEIWELLQREAWTTYDGRYYQLLDAPFEPKPVHGRLPMVIGGSKPRMLRLAARHADVWNVVGNPEDAGALNRQLDAACAEVGRDPTSIVRSVSPRLNLLASPDAFAAGVAAYRDAGFTDIYLPWPRTPEELPVLRRVARDVMPALRDPDAATSTAELREPAAGDLPALRAALARIDDPRLGLVLGVLIDHPDERFDGAAIVARTGIERHADVTRALAALAGALAERGLARPWNEAQSGWLVSQEQADLLGALRDPT
jgi:alkanesulfonate monooxygenase SsuD/methylene tetrahydromethanopterin reductase-like flavin-dependent oxidoreductase (luciferase family)